MRLAPMRFVFLAAAAKGITTKCIFTFSERAAVPKTSARGLEDFTLYFSARDKESGRVAGSWPSATYEVLTSHFSAFHGEARMSDESPKLGLASMVRDVSCSYLPCSDCRHGV